jgi:cell division protein FtsB
MDEIKYNRGRGGKNNQEQGFLIRLLDSGLGKISLVVLSILMLLSVSRSFRQMGQKLSLLKQAEQEVTDLRLDNLELSLQLEEAGTIDNLEKEARDRLNYGEEGEVLFVIDDELVEVGKRRVDEILNPKQETEDVKVLAQWVEFIIGGY